MVERLAYNEKVNGSNPLLLNNLKFVLSSFELYYKNKNVFNFSFFTIN